MSLVGTGEMASTFGNTPLGCAATNATLDLIEHLRKFQRLDRGGVPRDVAKIIVNRAIVHGELRRSRFDVDARYGFPAAPRAVKVLLGCLSQRIRC